MNVVCIIELQNQQEDYAKCLEFIKTIECKANYKGKQQQIDCLTKASRGLRIQIVHTRTRFSPRYLEEPINLSERGKEINTQLQEKHLLNEEDIKWLLSGEEQVSYHVRIHFNEKSAANNCGEIIHLQYLAMLLKYVEPFVFEDKGTKRRLTVFMVPTTGTEYPFQSIDGEIDYDTYDFTSQYLRLLSKRYTGVIYGLKQNNGQATVTSLEFRQSRQNTMFFPLLLIDNEKYEQIFVDSINDILSELFSLKKNQRFGEADAEDPNIAMRDYIAETDIKRMRDVVAPIAKDWEQERWEILKFLESKGDICLIHFSLFAFMLSDQKTNEENEVYSYESIWQMAQELSRGLRQIVQNALQHTQRRECFFAFYLHARGEQEEKNTFYKRIADRFPEVAFIPAGRDEALEIIISDINELEDMIDNFVGNLQYEMKQQQKIQKDFSELSGHVNIIKERDNLAIRNFFAEYREGDPIHSWMLFRREDLIAHIGLGQFAQTAGRCSAAVKVISSKESILRDEKHFFYKSYADGADNSVVDQELGKETYVIPGTQFSILVPIGALKNERKAGISQLRQKNHVAENYKSYAAFLEYKEQRIIVPLSESANLIGGTSEVLNAQKKYELVQRWTSYWKKKFIEQLNEKRDREEKKIFSTYVINYDFTRALSISYFTDSDYIEVCLKGIIGALEVVEKSNTAFYLAMTNLPDGFIDSFRRICTLLGVKDFPPRLQLCLQENYKGTQTIKRVIMLGNDFAQAISNSYVLSLEQGVDGFDKKDCKRTIELRNFLMPDNFLPENKLKKDNTVGAMPFDAILCSSENGSKSLFEKQLEEMAEGSLDGEAVGYKLNNTHMRLGSKVHIESFYEMSFLFYRTTIANRLAFMILRHLLDIAENESEINLLSDSILFYGYASYSKAILTSITEILQEYRIIKKTGTERNIAFASFQHNLMLESEETQMYFGLQDNDVLGKVDGNNHLILNGDTKIVQIVPISSTLTTFGKMWKKFMNSVSEATKDKISLVASYTIFWIVDSGGRPEQGRPSDIEKKYWERVEGKKIVTKLTALEGAGNSCVYFFKRSAVTWHDPLKCELCYPKYVIEEVPLVETDPTSTVPTQQIRYKGQRHQLIESVDEDFCERFSALDDCISYDHICRRQNHYQFYIDTQKYFYKVKSHVKKWLKNIGNELEESIEDPVLHIIFSPEHNTNVGFAQYVNVHYFKGLAEIVSINVDKQFRSNFVCEHAALKEMIEELYQDSNGREYCPVKFYFVDDTIITGETFEKANGLLQSLVPHGVYPTNLFSKIFLLIDRLSNDTRRMYVNDTEHNFMSFLHIDVSNTRTHGDSCIGCKLEQDAEKMFKRSATRNMAHHWSNKLKDYQKKEYDNRNKIAKINKPKSYRMLVFSHVMQNIMVKQERYSQPGDAYDAVMNLSCWLLNEEDSKQGNAYGFEQLLAHHRGIDGICALFKTICRPFLSYDFTIKRQFFTFFILLAELFMGAEECEILPKNLNKNVYLSYLLKQGGGRIENAKELVTLITKELNKQKKSILEFLRIYIFECLTDMGSTYVMRKQTLKKAYFYVGNEKNGFLLDEQRAFWHSYEINLHRLVSGNADETKELWLEYLYMTGAEYREFAEEYKKSTKKIFEPKFLYTEITGNIKGKKEDVFFYQFCCNLFLQNIGINFDNLEEKTAENSDSASGNDRFYKEYWHQMYCLTQFENPFIGIEKEELYNTQNEEALFCFLQSQKNQTDSFGVKSVKDWYQNLLRLIVDVISNKYHVTDINIALLTETMNKDKDSAAIQLMDIVEEKLTSCKIGVSETKYCIKNRVVNALNDTKLFDLENNGYFIDEDLVESGIQRPYVIAFFDNPKPGIMEEKTGLGQNIARVFLYISISQQEFGAKIQFILRLILREVMTYRNRILRCLQKDFAGDLYARYARKNGEQNILSHEKAHSHNTTADDLITLEVFQNQENFKNNYEKLTIQDAKDWLLLRNYTNGQIAKIFNRSFNDSHEENAMENDSPMLYILPNIQDCQTNPFKCALKRFSDLNLKNESVPFSDRRIGLLNEIIELQYERELEKAVFVQGKQEQYYNLEYFRCILIDMLISAIKFESTRPDFLLRIDRLFEIKGIQEECSQPENLWMQTDNEMIKWLESLKEERCTVRLYREVSPYKGVDYLIVRNPINALFHRMDDWEGLNESIEHRLKDPLDFADGHMSLLAIKRYVENLNADEKRECKFCYVCEENVDGEKKYFFENRLPVLKRECDNERVILD